MITPSKLRANLYRILDDVLETGEPVEISRGGRTLLIVSADQPQSRLNRVKGDPNAWKGNPDDVLSIDWSGEWNPSID